LEALTPPVDIYFQDWARLRRVDGTNAAPALDWWQATLGQDIEDGPARCASPAHHWHKRDRSVGVKARCGAGSWLANMLARKPRMLVVVALANKIARIARALMAHGGTYRVPASAAQAA